MGRTSDATASFQMLANDRLKLFAIRKSKGAVLSSYNGNSLRIHVPRKQLHLFHSSWSSWVQ